MKKKPFGQGKAWRRARMCRGSASASSSAKITIAKKDDTCLRQGHLFWQWLRHIWQVLCRRNP